jgi:hypothetical protein
MRPVRVLACVRRLLLVVGVAFAVLPVGSALADTTIGAVGGEFDPRLGPCPGNVVLADMTYVVPNGGGSITSFSFQVGFAGQQLDFLVLQPAGDNNYTVEGHTGVVTLPDTPVATFTNPGGIPVQGGEILGMWFPDQQPVEPGVPPQGGLVGCARAAVPGNGGILATDFGVADPINGETISFGGPDINDNLNESANLQTGGSGSPSPRTKDQCRSGGWRTFGQFKNHGDCVSFVATGGKNPPSGP